MTQPEPQPFILMPPQPEPSRWDWWRSVAFTAGMLGTLAGFIVLLAQEVLRDDIEIAAIQVPTGLAEAGLTPEVMARRLADHLARSAAAAQAVGAGAPGTDVVGSRLDFALPVAGISLASLAGRVRDALGRPQTAITGEVVRQGETMGLRLRLSGRGEVANATGFAPDAAEAMLAAAAPELWRVLQPRLYAWHIAETMTDQAALRARLDALAPSADTTTTASIRYLIGQSLQREGRLEEALAVFDAATRQTPSEALPWYGRASVLMALDRPRAALEAHARAVASHGRTAWTHLFVARAELARGRAAQALAAARAALAIDAGMQEARLAENRALVLLGRADEALELARNRHAERPDLAAHRLLLAEALLAASRPGEALAMADSAAAGAGTNILPGAIANALPGAAANPSPGAIAPPFPGAVAPPFPGAVAPPFPGAVAPRALLIMARALRLQDKPEEAIALLERAGTLAPDAETAAEISATRGALLGARDRPAEALAAFDSALALRPGWVTAWQGSIAALNALGRQEEAALAETRSAEISAAR